MMPTGAAKAEDEDAQEPSDVYLISNYEELKAFASLVNGGNQGANAKLTADIDASDDNWTPIERYSGTFDG